MGSPLIVPPDERPTTRNHLLNSGRIKV
ncbi:hypothetical protein LINPERHAP1_LOCUS9191 [Linum perenne]